MKDKAIIVCRVVGSEVFISFESFFSTEDSLSYAASISVDNFAIVFSCPFNSILMSWAW